MSRPDHICACIAIRSQPFVNAFCMDWPYSEEKHLPNKMKAHLTLPLPLIQAWQKAADYTLPQQGKSKARRVDKSISCTNLISTLRPNHRQDTIGRVLFSIKAMNRYHYLVTYPHSMLISGINGMLSWVQKVKEWFQVCFSNLLEL